MAPKLHVITVSTRSTRLGAGVAKWFFDYAKAHGKFDAVAVDLAEFVLPVYDEPKHPRFRDYQHAHTRKWSASVLSADAFVFVTPEYNYSPPPSFVNALDYVFWEWHYTPMALVSYGGVSGGLRAAQAERLMASTLKMVPLMEGVAIPNFEKQMKEGVFHANELNEVGAKSVLDELLRWTDALSGLRAELRKKLAEKK
jgi:NAD(P)H-dependent FMN reductase